MATFALITRTARARARYPKLRCCLPAPIETRVRFPPYSPLPIEALPSMSLPPQKLHSLDRDVFYV